MNDLKRELAPIDEAAWTEIEEEVTLTLKRFLAARKLVDFDGPRDWKLSAVNLGRTKELSPPPVEGTQARQRQVLPMVELNVPFELSRSELDCISRGAHDADLGPAINAARQFALAENRMIFHGYAAAGMQGIVDSATHARLSFSEDFFHFPDVVSAGIEVLRENGVGGPYAIVLNPKAYSTLARTAGSGGFPIIRHVQALVDKPIIWGPALDGALVLSLRGGDFELTVGRDASIGYLNHNESTVYLYLQESLAFRVATPEAAVAIDISTGTTA